MESAVEKRIKEMKETAEKVQQLKKEVAQTQPVKKETASAKRATAAKSEKKPVATEEKSLAWSTGVKCDIPFYLL